MKLRKTKKEFELFLANRIKYFTPILLIDSSIISIATPCGKETAWMELQYHYPYLNPTVRYNQKTFDLWATHPKKVDTFLIHELCHIITDPLYAKATSRYIAKEDMEDERERLTDHICNIIIKNNLNKE